MLIAGYVVSHPPSLTKLFLGFGALGLVPTYFSYLPCEILDDFRSQLVACFR